MTRINSNVSSLVAQNRLQTSNKDLNQALTRLSTGLRINKGSDDPAGLIASEALRSEITSLEKSVSNTSRASQIISTADSALGQVSNLLNDVRGLVVEAANSGALSGDEISANQLQLDSSLEAINRIAQTTTFQGRKLLDGSLGFVTRDGVGAENLSAVSIDQANLGVAGQVGVDIDVAVAATKATATIDSFGVAAGQDASAGLYLRDSADDADNWTLFHVTRDGTGPAGNGASLNLELVSDLGTTPVANVDSDGNVTLQVDDDDFTNHSAILTALNDLSGFSATQYYETRNGAPVGIPTYDFDTTDPTAAFENGTFAGGTEDLATVPADVVFELQGVNGSEVFNIKAGTTLQQVVDQINLVSDATGVTASADGNDLSLSGTDYGSDSLVDLRVLEQGAGGNFDDMRSLGTDIEATVNGRAANGKGNAISINTSSLDLSATLADDFVGSVRFDIQGGGAKFQLGPDVVGNQQARVGIGSVSSARLGGVSGKLYELGSGESASLSKDPAKAAQIVSEAIEQVTSLRGRLGAFQATTLESNLVSLNETVANLKEAESSIRDADFAKESAALTRAQILVQSGTNVLSLANQNPQNVLSLIR